MTDPAYNEWQRMWAEAEQAAAHRVKAAVATVHYPLADSCAWCQHPWPCKTAQAVELDEIIEDRERIIRGVQSVLDGQPHRELLRPTVMQIVGIIRRGGA